MPIRCSAPPGKTRRTRPTPTGRARGRTGERGRRTRALPPAAAMPGRPARRWPCCSSPLCDATDALARLDARAAAAPDASAGRPGRAAWRWPRPPAGWPTPMPGSTRSTSRCATPASPAAPRSPPSGAGTVCCRRPSPAGHRRQRAHADADGRTDWDHQTVDAVADGDRALADALALAQVLRRLAGARGKPPFATAADAEATLGGVGAGPLDAMRFVDWRETFAPAPVPRRRFGSREGQGGPKRPALLRAAQAAAAWMEAGIADDPTPLQALLAAIALLARGGPAGTVFVPVWAAYPAVGFGDRAALPTLRSDAADRLVGRDQPVTWPLAFLHLVAESARMGLRTLDRLEAVAEQGRGLAAGGGQALAAARRGRRPAARPGADAQGARRAARDRAADRDGVAAGTGRPRGWSGR